MIKWIRRALSKQSRSKAKLSPIVLDDTNAASRLRDAGRIPINIWGDIILDGTRPQVRRVLTGQDAHESLLSFFYLAEVLTLDEVVSAIPDQEGSTEWPKSVTARYAALKRTSRDPHNQLGDEVLQVFVPTALFFKLIGEGNSELCELGCTFFSAIDKMKICSSLLEAQLDLTKILCAAVDHSDYFLRGALKLHRGDNVVPYRDYAHWRPSTPYPFHLSRFVASYAVSSTDEFANWLSTFGAFHIIDVFNMTPSDFATANNGLRQIFFNLPKLIGRLNADGWDVYANGIDQDFNSGQRCVVVKMFGIKREIENRIRLTDALAAHADLAALLPMEPLTEQTVLATLQRINASLSDSEWAALADYKKHFPIWGRPVGPASTPEEVEAIMASPQKNVDLTFESGQINYYVRQALGE